jgi:hypothetical protein
MVQRAIIANTVNACMRTTYSQVVNNYLEEQGIVGKLQESIHAHMTYLLRWRR